MAKQYIPSDDELKFEMEIINQIEEICANDKRFNVDAPYVYLSCQGNRYEYLRKGKEVTATLARYGKKKLFFR